MDIIRTAMIQMEGTPDREKNLAAAEQYTASASAEGASLCVLPEMFLCPYAADAFPGYAEEEGGSSWQRLSALAKKCGVILAAGSIPEKDEAGKIYNTSYVFDSAGRQIARHRKMHLFDIAVEGGQHFRESETLSPGEEITVFETPFGKMGLAICYDIRFPHLAEKMAAAGAGLLIYPASFNMTTGPAHWELLLRARALDNQVFTLGCSQARNPSASYVSYGNSMIVSPWGKILTRMDENAGISLTDLDLSEIAKVREELPVLRQKHLIQGEWI